MSNDVVVELDDTDPRMRYTGAWFVADNGASTEFDGTTHGTLTAGSSVTFTFNGTFVTVYGTVGSTNASARFILDNTFTNFFVPQPPAPLYHQTFFQSSSLPDTQHTLIMTSTQDGSYFYFDALKYNTTASDFNPVASVSASSNSPAPTRVSTAPRAGATSSAVKAGVVVSAVIGTIAALATIVLLAFYMRRKMRQEHRLDLLSDKPGTCEPPVTDNPPDTFNGVPIIRAPVYPVRMPVSPGGGLPRLPSSLAADYAVPVSVVQPADVEVSKVDLSEHLIAREDYQPPDLPNSPPPSASRLPIPKGPRPQNRVLAITNSNPPSSFTGNRDARLSGMTVISLPNPYDQEVEPPVYEEADPALGSPQYEDGIVHVAGGPARGFNVRAGVAL